MNTALLACQKFLHPDKPTQASSEDVKVKLREIGWVDGDPIPGGMAEYAKAILKALSMPVSSKNVLKIFDYEEVKATLISALRHAKAVQDDTDLIEEEVKKLVPNTEVLSDAVKKPLKELATKVAKKNIRKKAKNFSVTEDVDDEFEEVAEDIPEPEVEKKEDAHIIHYCPRCALDLTKPYEPITVTEDDKNAFMVAMLGDTPFCKTYKVFNDFISVTYKSLTSEEILLVTDQLRWDMFNRILVSESQRVARSYQYTFALSVADMLINKEGFESPAILPWKSDKFKSDNNTNLKMYYDYIHDNVFSVEMRYTLLLDAYTTFCTLLGKLREEIQNPNFWKTPSDKN